MSHGKEDLSGVRGLSEPYFIGFDVTKNAATMVCHGVIFCSFEVSCRSEENLRIGDLERDPRGKQFIEFILSNYGKKAVQAIKEEIIKRSAEIDALDRKLKQLRQELKKEQSHE